MGWRFCQEHWQRLQKDAPSGNYNDAMILVMNLLTQARPDLRGSNPPDDQCPIETLGELGEEVYQKSVEHARTVK